MTRSRRIWATRGLCLLIAVATAGCGTNSASSRPSNGSPRATAGRVVEVVAAENFWGSIAAQLGGVHVHVMSIITNPNTDPHSYEPTAADAQALAESQFVIENGIGYDPWVARLLSADQGSSAVLDVGSLLGVPDGGNPHRWYDPSDVQRVIAQIVDGYQKLDPPDRSYFAERHTQFDTVTLKQYDSTIAAIRSKFSGTPVGASESIFAMIAPALGLDLITPPTFLRAISEGIDVSVADKVTIDDQIRGHQIKIYVGNSQNVTPDVQAQLNEVKAEHIPVATITETLQPAGASYQAWQTKQLLAIETALVRSGA